MPSRTWQHAAQHLHIPTEAPLRPLWALLPPLSNHSAMRSSTSQNLTDLLALSFSGLQAPLRLPLQFPASIHPLSFQFFSPGRQVPSARCRLPHRRLSSSASWIQRLPTFFFFQFHFYLTSVPIWYILVSMMSTQAGFPTLPVFSPSDTMCSSTCQPCDLSAAAVPFATRDRQAHCPVFPPGR